jgi:hypothetical protein
MKSVSQEKITLAVVFALPLLLLCSVRVVREQARPLALSGSGAPFPLSVHGTAAAVLTTGTFAPPMAPALGLAMADFTGDTHPDLATVEMDRSDFSSPHYWIEIQLTEGGRQFLSLTAPFGGLLITPKDVTGDGNLDLVVRTAKSHTPVAVFLNDGSGHFSRADIAAFANALHDSPSQFRFTTQQTYLGVTLACLESYTAECPTGSRRYLREQKSSLLSSHYRTASQPFLTFGANRAPPSLA